MTSTMMVAGRYSLDREIGRGGAGAVFLGRDEVLGRVVALKRIGNPPGGADPDLARAEREAQLAARVNHPHVVAVFDLAEDGDQQWLVMEYVDGINLAEQIRRDGPLTPDEAAPILAQVADALAAAHAAGIVHRDVKPSNILVSADGSVKLSDFGIARAQADAVLTQTGLVTGSPAYLSPEVASGQMASAPSDVWSLGATLYHALAGHPPYDVGDNLMGALYRIVHEEPPRLRTAGWLGPLLEVTMSQEPTDRPSMRDVGDYLRARRTDEVAPPVPPAAGEGTQLLRVPPPLAIDDATHEPTRGEREADARSNRRVLPFILAAVVVVALIAIGFLLLIPDPQDNADDPNRAATPSDTGRGGPTSPDQSGQSSPAAPTAAEMTEFVEQYPVTAANDPAAGFALLTPAYQERSGGLPGYRGFWGGVSDPQVTDVQADPTTLTVSYTYSYVLNGDPTTEDVSLQLEQDGDGFLIADD